MCVCVSWQQEFASHLHYHVAREYVGQLMKNNYKCKNRKHEKAAKKIRDQWNVLRDLFEDMVINSTSTFSINSSFSVIIYFTLYELF